MFVLPSQAALVLLDQIAIIVDEDVIMQSEIEDRIRSVKGQLAASPSGNAPPDDVLQNQIVERLIIENLQLQMADRAGVRISDDELNQALRSIAGQNKMSLEQFRAAIESDGMAWREMREQVRREIAISRVQQGIMRKRIQISEQEIKNFLASEVGEAITADEYRLGHILLALPSTPVADDIRATRTTAEELLVALESGADFNSLAIEWSSGQNALEGGDMGWRKPVQLPSMFSGLVDDMTVGDVRGPIKSGRGYHLIKLLEKRGATAEGQVAQTQVRHVLIKPNEIRTDQEASDLAISLRQEVVGGRDFSEVAKLYSDDPGSALSGGDLGWTRAGVFVPEFEETMQNIEPNQISEVFKTEHGYHFLEVTGSRVEDFSERFRMGQADNYLYNQKFDEELESWVREIREEAFVEIKI
jgi:peptidyl-prolyl cis-trans isomerase SurA